MIDEDPEPDYWFNKWERTIIKKQELLESFNRRSHNEVLGRQDTSLLELVIRSNIRIDNDQIMKILKIDKEDEHQVRVFNAIVYHVKDAVSDIYKCTKISEMNQLPLTNLLRILYYFSQYFNPIFNCPFKVSYHTTDSSRGNLHLRPRSQSSTSTIEGSELVITKFAQKYNQNWILAYMFKREFKILDKGVLTIRKLKNKAKN